MKIETYDDEIMLSMAHRYCLGRSSYMVSLCINWLELHWNQLGENTQNTIIKETMDALSDNMFFMDMDRTAWKHFLWNVVQNKEVLDILKMEVEDYDKK